MSSLTNYGHALKLHYLHTQAHQIWSSDFKANGTSLLTNNTSQKTQYITQGNKEENYFRFSFLLSDKQDRTIDRNNLQLPKFSLFFLSQKQLKPDFPFKLIRQVPWLLVPVLPLSFLTHICRNLGTK